MSLPVLRRRDGRVELRFSPEVVALLRSVFTEVVDLLGPPPEEVSTDPLAAALGIGVVTAPPEDPALQRLLPDAYADDPEAASDFRRFTELGLRERKRTNAATALATLADGKHPVVLELPQVHAWLGALNDARLALGVRLDIDEEWEDRLAGASEQERYQLEVYDFLTFLQETMVRLISR